MPTTPEPSAARSDGQELREAVDLARGYAVPGGGDINKLARALLTLSERHDRLQEAKASWGDRG